MGSGVQVLVMFRSLGSVSGVRDSQLVPQLESRTLSSAHAFSFDSLSLKGSSVPC